MHGVPRPDPIRTAGDWVLIHHNTFSFNGGQSIRIEGIPTERAEIHHNWFPQPSHNIYDAVDQYNGYGNFDVYENQIGPLRILADEIHY